MPNLGWCCPRRSSTGLGISIARQSDDALVTLTQWVAADLYGGQLSVLIGLHDLSYVLIPVAAGEYIFTFPLCITYLSTSSYLAFLLFGSFLYSLPAQLYVPTCTVIESRLPLPAYGLS